MKKIPFRQIALLSLIVLPIIFSGIVSAQPVPIGDPAYKQKESFDSNPAAGDYSGIGTPSGVITNVFDGDLATNINWVYGASASGFVNVTGFKSPSATNGNPDFTITFIDIKVDYRAQSTAASDDQYRIVFYFGGNTHELQTWVFGTDILAGTSAFYPPGVNANPAVRTFSNVAKPGGGAWTWADLASLKVGFESQVVGTNNFQRVYLHEIWITAYSTPFPDAGTMSVQTPVIAGLVTGDLFYVDIYVTNVVRLWGYQFVLNFDPAVLVALEYMSYSPFISALPSEIGPDYVAVSYNTYNGDPIGLNGSTPVTRIYFSVVADGSSALSFSQIYGADVYGNALTFAGRNGVFATSLVRDIAVTNVKVSNSTVLPNEFMTINATVVNQGTVAETFNVTAFYDSTPIEIKNVTSLTPGGAAVLTYNWNTTGVVLGQYQLKVQAEVVFGEIDTQNNLLVFGTVVIGRHNIAVTHIVRAYSNGTVVPVDQYVNVTRADIVNINVTVSNLGNFTEVFDVTLVWEIAQNNIIENKTNVSLDPGVSKNLTFVWNTDVTSPPWSFGFDRYQKPLNFLRAAVRAVATPDWSTGHLIAKGVPYEKGADYDFTKDNDVTDGDVRVNRDFRYPTARFNISPLDLFVTEPALFDGGPPGYSSPGTSLDLSHNFTIVHYAWDFGDGNTATGNYPNIYHAYSKPGNYTARLTVTNNMSLSDSVATFDIGGPSRNITVVVRNLRVMGIAFSPATGVVGQQVKINVTIRNFGVDDETLVVTRKNVSVYYDNNIFIAKAPAPDLGAYGSPGHTDTRIVRLNWTTTGLTPGVHTIKAVLDPLDFENNTGDNVLIGSFSFDWHNIKVTTISVSKTEATIGDSITVSVTVLNQGNFTESFTLTLTVNGTTVGTAQTVTDLVAGATKTLTFTWDTSGLDSGRYVFKAVASNVTLEAVTSDNTFSGTSVTLSPPSNMLIYIIIGAIAVIVVVAAVGVYFLRFRKPKQSEASAETQTKQ